MGDYVRELLSSQVEIFDKVRSAQEQCGEANRRRAEAKGVGDQVQVGDFVLLRRTPDAVRRERGHDKAISNRLLPRTSDQP